MNYELSFKFKVQSVKDLPMLRLLIEENNMNKPNFSELSRELGKARNTVKRWYYSDGSAKRKDKYSKVDKFKDRLLDLFSSNKKFYYIQHLYDYLVDQYGDEVNFEYSTFRHYIRKYYNKEFKNNITNTIGNRFETPAGEQIQFDLKENQKVIDMHGIEYSVDIATIVMGYSRFTYRELIPDKTQDTIIDFFVRYFEMIGGVPITIVIDNITALVNNARYKEQPAILNVKFDEFCKDFNIRVIPCIVKRANTKGKVETQMKPADVIHNYNGDFSGLGGLIEVIKKIDERYSHRNSQAHGLPPILLLDKEKEQLQPLPTPEICSKYKLVTKKLHVSNDGLFSYKSKKYSLPAKYRNKSIKIRIVENKIQVYDNTNLICIHQISDKHLNYLEDHYIEAQQLVSKKDVSKQAAANFKKMSGIKYE